MIATLLCLALVAPPPAPDPAHDVVLDAMKDELARTKELKLADTPAPYWASYHVVDVEALHISAKLGALYDTQTTKSRAVAPRIRVGDLELDAVGVPMFEEPIVGYEDDYEALRHALWRYSDGAYKMAAAQYRRELTDKAQNTVDPERPAAFTSAEPIVSIANPTHAKIDREALETLARRVSAVFREHEHVRDAEVTIAVQGTRRRFASTEGSIVVDGSQIIIIQIQAITQADDGDMIGREIAHVVRPGELPDAAALEADAARLAEELLALRKAPLVRDYSGPVLFEAAAAGPLFAQALGSQLVASGHWGGEVDGKLGQLVLPKSLDVVDDPLATLHDGRALLGGFAVDDEGVRSERVQLVRGGKLVGLLSARAPGKKIKRSNGHGRSAPHGMDVRPGASNLLVTSKGGLSAAAMEKKLMALVHQRGAEFGLVIADGGGRGGNLTAYRIGKNGKRELVRVGYMQGLDLRQLRDIAAVGKTTAVSHGMQMGGHPMGISAVPPSMAGFVSPISIVAPAVLLRDAELHAFTGSNPKPPAYPRPALRKK